MMDNDKMFVMYQDLVDDSEPMTKEATLKYLEGYDSIDVGLIYTNEEQNEKIPSFNFIVYSEISRDTDDEKIYGSFVKIFKEYIEGYTNIYIRVSPEISESSEGTKLFYARFVVIE